MQTLILIGDTLELVGKLLVSWLAISVHHRVRHKHKINNQIFNTMRRESTLGIFGMALMILGYALRNYVAHLL